MKKVLWRMLVVALAAVAVTLLYRAPVSFYSASGAATNVVTSGNIRLIIHETTSDGTEFPEEGVYVIPGQIVSKQVNVENDCEHPFYLRVKLVNGTDRKELSSENCLDVNINDNAWTVKDDGYIYYNKVLYPGEKTPAVFTEVKIVGEKVDNSYIGSTLSLTVNAYAVQEENNPANNPWDAVGWPAEEEAK